MVVRVLAPRHIHGNPAIHDRGLRYLGEFVGGGKSAERHDDHADDLRSEQLHI